MKIVLNSNEVRLAIETYILFHHGNDISGWNIEYNKSAFETDCLENVTIEEVKENG